LRLFDATFHHISVTLGKGDVNIIKNSLPEDGFPIVEISSESLEIPVLSDVDIKIERAELVAIMSPSSPSGSGKSVLGNLIDCLDRPTKEQVLVKCRDLNRMSDQELAHLTKIEISFVSQTFNLAPHLTDLENVLLPTFANLKINIDQEGRAREPLEVTEPHNRIRHRLGELSGGKSKRVSIACVLINNLVILLVDEPIGNLNTRTGAEILRMFMGLNNEERTLVITTHYPEITKYTRVVLAKDGITQYN
jgi:putative ABC transport system ATP-binding protein